MLIDFIVCMCLLQFETEYGVVLFFTFAWGYLGYLVYLDQNTRSMLKQMSNQFCARTNNKLRSKIATVQQLDLQSNQLAMSTSELYPVYSNQLQWRLFLLCKVDFEFIFHTSLFLLNYIVLITQTNTL